MKKNWLFLVCFLMIISCKQVKRVPYTAVEMQNDTLSFQNEEGYWSRKDGFPGFSFPKLEANTYVTNKSNYDGTFTVVFAFQSQGDETQFEDKEYVRAGERKQFSIEKEINHYTYQKNVSLNVKVIPAIIMVKRTVIKYRLEEHYFPFN